MSRLWILLIPAVSPFALLLGWYLVEVVPALFEPTYGSSTLIDQLRWGSQYWWYGHFSSDPMHGGRGSIEFLLATCTLAFLVGCILALALYLFLPRPSAVAEHHGER